MSETLEKRILRLLRSEGYFPVRIRRLARLLEISPDDYAEFRRTVGRLVAEGKVDRVRGGKLAAPASDAFKQGEFIGLRSGAGFVNVPGLPDELFVPEGQTGHAIHGDTVEVRIMTGRRDDRPAAEVTRVVKREPRMVIGTVRSGRTGLYLDPDSSKYPHRIPVSSTGDLRPRQGQKVAAILQPIESGSAAPAVRITEILGFPDEPTTSVKAVMRMHGLPETFPAKVKAAASRIRAGIPDSERVRRLDLRKELTFTIDPEDAKDHDDAVSLGRTAGGNYVLGVHIADVAHYVSESGAIDKEALERGTSVYLVDRVIPMLPEGLSSDLCSLVPGQDRLTVSCFVELTPEGKMVGHNIEESIIRSHYRLNYRQVQDHFDGAGLGERSGRLKRMLDDMLKLARILHNQRARKGSLDFDLPEAKVRLDSSGRVVDITEEVRLESHRLVEEFMLLANRVVATHLAGRNIPILYRVHEKPSEEKVEALTAMLTDLGYGFSFKGEITAKKLQRVLREIAGKPEEKLVNQVLLRTMMKARYQPENIGHFALAFPTYTHFTSPIRRYPDLTVHRTLKAFLQKKLTRAKVEKLHQVLPAIGRTCSEAEIRAEEAERDSIRVKQIEYIADHIGDVYSGVISGISRSGIFVQINGILVDGRIAFTDIDGDYYEAHGGKHAVKGRRSDRVFRLGDPVEVQVMRVDAENKEVDLVLVPDEPPRRRKKSRGSSPAEGRKRRRRNKQ